MGAHAMATFEIKSWDENPFSEVEGGQKLTRASVMEVFHGDIEGEGIVEYLMAYQEGGSATFVRMERIVGRLGDKSGSFVLEGSGSYDAAAGVAKGTWLIVPGSGTGALRGLKGEGGFSATHEPPGHATLEYDIEK